MHEYAFFGADTRDPAGSGIEVIPADRLRRVRFSRVRTWQVERAVAFQPAVVRAAINDAYEALILKGALTYPSA